MKFFRLLLLICVTQPALDAQPAAKAKSPVANVYPIREGFVDGHGLLIYYWEIGRGIPLMVVHGGPGASHDYFLPYLLPLARHNRLIFIDERGSGKSQKLDDAAQYTVENMVEDCEAVRQALGLGKISLLGHSYGGVMAQTYALKYQKNLSHLILSSTIASTRELNDALAKMKSAMASDDREKLDSLEKAGLFGKGLPYERGRYPDEYAKLAWGIGYFPYYYQRHPNPNADPLSNNTPPPWNFYPEWWGPTAGFMLVANLKSLKSLIRFATIKLR